MRSLLIAFLLCASASAETVMVEFAVEDNTPARHRVVFDPAAEPVMSGGGFRLWEVPGFSLSEGSSHWVAQSDALIRMWTPSQASYTRPGADFTVIQFNQSGDSVDLLVDGSRSEMPSRRDLARATILDHCTTLRMMDELVPVGFPGKGLHVRNECPGDRAASDFSIANMDMLYGIHPRGDLDRDFDVDFQDYQWLANGYSVGGSVAEFSMAPEPASAALALFLMPRLLNGIRRRSKKPGE